MIIQGQGTLSPRKSEEQPEQQVQSEASAPPAEAPEEDKSSSNVWEHTEEAFDKRPTDVGHETSTSDPEELESAQLRGNSSPT